MLRNEKKAQTAKARRDYGKRRIRLGGRGQGPQNLALNMGFWSMLNEQGKSLEGFRKGVA